MSRVIGIDLGTTSSCVAVIEGDAPRVVPNRQGQRSTPSVVAFAEDGTVLVGEPARRESLVNPSRAVFGVKRLIGRKFDSPECRAAQLRAPFELVPADNGDARVRVADRVYSLPEISSFILHELKASAEEHLGEAVDEAVLTVPAYFNDAQRQATRDAATIAGLRVRRILNEPTAAALSYGARQAGQGEFFAVYDLGGGTFDISILEMSDGLLQVHATGGNTFLGGDDFDERVMDWLLSEYREQSGAEVHRRSALLASFRDAAERAKCELAAATEAEVVVPVPGCGSLRRTLTRAHYESLTRDLLAQTVASCERCLADAGLSKDSIDRVLLVGGQSRAPGVAELVRRLFGREPSFSLHPGEAIAEGAAIQAGITCGGVKDLVLLDVTPHSLGIETRDGTFAVLIDRNTTIPTRQSRVFSTVADDQSCVAIHVLQGENRSASHNLSLARVDLTGIRPARAGRPRIEVVFEIDIDGVVHVEATELETRRAQGLTVRPSGGLGPEELGRAAAEMRARHEAPNRPTQ